MFLGRYYIDIVAIILDHFTARTTFRRLSKLISFRTLPAAWGVRGGTPRHARTQAHAHAHKATHTHTHWSTPSSDYTRQNLVWPHGARRRTSMHVHTHAHFGCGSVQFSGRCCGGGCNGGGVMWPSPWWCSWSDPLGQFVIPPRKTTRTRGLAPPPLKTSLGRPPVTPCRILGGAGAPPGTRARTHTHTHTHTKSHMHKLVTPPHPCLSPCMHTHT